MPTIGSKSRSPEITSATLVSAATLSESLSVDRTIVRGMDLEVVTKRMAAMGAELDLLAG
jgi:hypothetical protein